MVDAPMPTTRYPVDDAFLAMRNAAAVDWGVEVEHDEAEAVTWFETEVSSEADAARLQTAYQRRDPVMPASYIRAGQTSTSNVSSWTISNDGWHDYQIWNSPTWTNTRITTTPTHYREYRRAVQNHHVWDWSSTTYTVEGDNIRPYDVEWVTERWQAWNQEWQYYILNETTGADRRVISTRQLSPEELPRTPEREETAEEMQARREERERARAERNERLRREQEEYEARRRERREREEQAQARSLELLPVVLSAAELKHFKKKKEIVITGSAGTKFRINQRGHSGNVDVLAPDGKTRIAQICAHPNMYAEGGGHLPDGDAWVGQILALKTDEDHFIATANIHWCNVVEFRERHDRLRGRSRQAA